MIEKFDTLDDYMDYAAQASRDGVRVKLRSGLEIEVPDGYKRGQTSAQVEAELLESQPSEPSPKSDPEPEPEIETTEPKPDPPNKSATRKEWADHASEIGIDPTDLTKSEIISKVEGA